MAKTRPSVLLLLWYQLKIAEHLAENDGEKFEEYLETHKQAYRDLGLPFARMGSAEREVQSRVYFDKLINFGKWAGARRMFGGSDGY